MVEHLNIDWLRDNGENIRVHGNRFIQIDLADGTERVHIWSDHVPKAQDYPTPIHDHVFGFHSKVLAGTLIDIRYRIAPHKPESSMISVYDIFTYDVYTAQARQGSDTALVKTGERVIADIATTCAVPAGAGYMVEPREFHTTTYVGYAITRIRKTKWVEGTPRVLCRTTMDPDNGFERYKYDADMLWDIVARMLEQAKKEKGNVATEGSIPV